MQLITTYRQLTNTSKQVGEGLPFSHITRQFNKLKQMEMEKQLTEKERLDNTITRCQERLQGERLLCVSHWYEKGNNNYMAHESTITEIRERMNDKGEPRYSLKSYGFTSAQDLQISDLMQLAGTKHLEKYDGFYRHFYYILNYKSI